MVNGGLNYKDLKVAKFLSVDLGNQLYGCILSNYGDPLKLMIPNHNGNFMSGWTNYSDLLHHIIIIMYIVFDIYIAKIYNYTNELYNKSVAKVTSHKINESAMGNRVAKSNINYLGYYFSLSLFSMFVKVQRVYGSNCIRVNFIITHLHSICKN